MDNKVKSGGITLSGICVFTLGMWGYMRAAQDMTNTILGLSEPDIYFLCMLAGCFIFSFGLASYIALNISFYTNYKRKKNNAWKAELIPLEDVAGIMLALPNEEAISPETTLNILKEAAKRGLITIYGVDRAFPSTISKIKPDFWKIGGVFHVEHAKLNITIYRSSRGKMVYQGGKIDQSDYTKFKKFVMTHRNEIVN